MIRGLVSYSFLFVMAGTPLHAGAHTWDVNEIFSNADGTIQFVELMEANGTPNETGVHNQTLRSLTVIHDIDVMIASPTSNKFLLFATAGFAALPGAPMPDEIITDNFLSVVQDTITYGPYDSLSFGSGQLPTDGIMSFNDGGVIAANSPTNYAGISGSVDASPPPPAVPNGMDGTAPMDVTPLDLTASSVSITWDTSTCTGAVEHHVIYGEGSELPTSPGGTFTLTGSVCAIGAPPFVWTPTPTAGDGSGLVWWLIVASKSGVEGSWGLDSNGLERLGPGPALSSGQCGVSTRDLTNTCGN